MKRLLPMLLLGATLSCQTTPTAGGEPSYTADAESNLQRGNDALAGGNYQDAEKYFEYVRSKYPFLEASKEAELKLADTDFARDQFLEARDRYLSFVKLHPTHPKVDYAAFRAALTHYREIPGDFFLIPSSREKDQAEVKSTLASMQDFVRQYPKSQYAPEAERLALDARKRLAEHELYVADFYARREKWPAVVGRLQTVVRRYAGLGYEERAYFRMHDAYLKMKQPEQAKKVLQEVLERLPNTRAAERARSMLGQAG